MTRVSGIGAGSSPARRATRVGGGFALPGLQSAELAATPAAGGVAALLAMQEQAATVAAPGERAARRAGVALDELRGLQLDLLRGVADPRRLERLAALTDASSAAAEPALRTLLDEIGVRVKVELARHRAARSRVVAGA